MGDGGLTAAAGRARAIRLAIPPRYGRIARRERASHLSDQKARSYRQLKEQLEPVQRVEVKPAHQKLLRSTLEHFQAEPSNDLGCWAMQVQQTHRLQLNAFSATCQHRVKSAHMMWG